MEAPTSAPVDLGGAVAPGATVAAAHGADNVEPAGTAAGPSSGHDRPKRSYSHLTNVAAAIAMRDLDAALRPAGAASSSGASLPAGPLASQGGTAPGKRPLMRVADVEDSIRLTAERKVLLEKHSQLIPRAQWQAPNRSQRRSRSSLHERIISSAQSAERQQEQPASKRPRRTAGKLSERLLARAAAAGAAAETHSPGDVAGSSAASGKGMARALEQVYAPFSLPHLLARLATYSLARYALYKKARLPLPDSAIVAAAAPPSADTRRRREAQWRAWVEGQLAPVRAARLGWCVSAPTTTTGASGAGGKECLECGTCGAAWSVEAWLAGDEARDAFSAHVAEQEAADTAATAGSSTADSPRHQSADGDKDTVLWRKHKDWCPWRVKWSAASLYALQLHARPALLQELLCNAEALVRVLGHGGEDHASASALRLVAPPHGAEQHASLVRALQEYAMRQQDRAAMAAAGSDGSAPSGTAALADSSDLSLGVAFTRAPESIQSQAALLALLGWDLAPSKDRSSDIRVAQAVLTCAMCQRKLGLWAFLDQATSSAAPARRAESLDAVKQHRDFCAFVTPPPAAALSAGLSSSRAGATANLAGGDGLDEELRVLLRDAGVDGASADGQHDNQRAQPQLVGWQLRLQTVLNRPLEGGSAHGTSGALQAPIDDRSGLRSLKGLQLVKQVRELLG